MRERAGQSLLQALRPCATRSKELCLLAHSRPVLRLVGPPLLLLSRGLAEPTRAGEQQAASPVQPVCRLRLAVLPSAFCSG